MADSQRKTANLCNPTPYKAGYYINAEGQEVQNNVFDIYSISATANQSYTISANVTLGGNTVRIHAYTNGTWTEQVKAESSGDLPWSFTAPTGCDEIRISITHNAYGHIMVNTGSTALPYEPYGWVHSLRKQCTATETIQSGNTIYADGTAITAYTLKGNTVQNGTPTPSNPVEVNGVGVRTENLFDVNGAYSLKSNSITITNNSITATLGGSGTDRIYYTQTYTAGTYKISFDVQRCEGRLYSNKEFTGSTYNSYYDGYYRTITGVQTITFAEDFTIGFILAGAGGNNAVVSNIMFQLSTSTADYEPYGYKIPILTNQTTTNIYLSAPLYKIGNYADVINADGTVSRRIAKLTFNGDGSVTWNKSSTYQGSFYAYNALVGGLNLWTPMVCTHATWVYPVDVSHYVYGTCGADGSPPNPNLNLFIGQADWNVTQFNQFLAENPVTVYYVLATATTEQITLPTIATIEGANSITVDTTVQPSEFTATWTGWHNSTVKEWDGSQWQ